jgi:hypothetical protein
MADRLTDGRLELALGELGEAISWPAAEPGLPAAVSTRVSAEGRAPRWWPAWSLRGWAWPGPSLRRPARRSLLVAVALLLVLAAVAAAIGFGLRGWRIVVLPPSVAPSGSLAPSADATRAGFLAGLGSAVDPAEAAPIVGFEPLVLRSLGEPGAAFVADRRLTLVWSPRAGWPEIDDSDLGVLLTEFRGRIDEGWYEKLIDAGATTVEAVRVGEAPGYWISGQIHQLVYRDPSGRFVEESRRTVGDVLVWQTPELTLRLETAGGREATIALAETLGAE